MNTDAVRAVAAETLSKSEMARSRRQLQARLSALERMGLREQAEETRKQLAVIDSDRQVLIGYLEALRAALAAAPVEVGAVLSEVDATGTLLELCGK